MFRLRTRYIGNMTTTVKGLETYLEAALQIQLQLHVFCRGFDFGTIQFFAMAASIFSIIWNTMEWNWIGLYGVDINENIKIRLKLLPLFLLSTGYKCISLSVIISYLRWYSAPVILAIICSLTTLDFTARKIHSTRRKTSNIKHRNRDQKPVRKYEFQNVILVISSLSALSLPRLPRHALHFQAAEKTWYRWESRITFLGYTLTMAIVLLLRDFGALPFSNCSGSEASFLRQDENFVVSMTLATIFSGIMNLIILEFYLKWGKDLLLEHTKYKLTN